MKLLKLSRAVWLAALLVGSLSGAEGGCKFLEKCFLEPSREARPLAYWFWMNGNVRAEGITKDLETMKRAGLGGAVVFNVHGWVPDGDVVFMSREWRELAQHTLREGARLGLEIGFHNAPGWSSSGGSWNRPEDGMQRVVVSEAKVRGPRKVTVDLRGTDAGWKPALPGAESESLVLPEPHSVLGQEFYRDVAVVAFPSVKGEEVRMEDFGARVSGGIAGKAGRISAVSTDASRLVFPMTGVKGEVFAEVEFEKNFRAQTVGFELGWGVRSGAARVEVSDDGKVWRRVGGSLSVSASGRLQSHSFPMTEAKFFRLVFGSLSPRPKEFVVRNFSVSPRRCVDDLPRRAFFARGTVRAMNAEFAGDEVVDVESVIDLSGKMGRDGSLSWDVPEGEWTVLRAGHAPTGQIGNQPPKNGPQNPVNVDPLEHEVTERPASFENLAIECDKLSRTAVERHWEKGLPGTILRDAGEREREAFRFVTVDSFEVGSQNWTPGFEREFARRNGYALLKFLPVFSGRVVGSPEMTDRFLWDFRRTVADMMAENYPGTLRKIAEKNGMEFALENYGNGPFDDVQYGGQAGQLWSEFWISKGIDTVTPMVAGAAHVYGRRVVGAEAFTAGAGKGNRWELGPFGLKPLGDAMFASGINRFVFHVWVHQPWENAAPGISPGSVGTQFNRFLTWWGPGRAWVDYLSRCQSLLQQGLPVADVLFFPGEGAPPAMYGGHVRLKLPFGYAFDGCSQEAILKLLSVRDGRIVLPGGGSYRMLVLSGSEMSLPVLRKLKAMADAGAVIAGPRPVRTPGLQGWPESEAELKRLTDELWGGGKILDVKDAGAVLEKLGVPPDFDVVKGRREGIRFLHRSVGGAEVYFVANYEQRAAELEVFFRVRDKMPELWDADSGRMADAGVWAAEGGGVRMPLRLDAGGSVFVVFRKKAEGDHAVGASGTGRFEVVGNAGGGVRVRSFENGKVELKMASGRTVSRVFDKVPPAVEVGGSWTVEFPKVGNFVFEKLVSWTEHAEADVKYFSGTATYRKEFEVTAACPGEGCLAELDLGEVRELARVRLNGRDLGVLWKPPFVVDATGALRAGKNVLEVEVTNLWVNRLIGDEFLPDEACEWRGNLLAKWPAWLTEGKVRTDGRQTFLSRRLLWTKGESPLRSGLSGPVVVRFGEEAVWLR